MLKKKVRVFFGFLLCSGEHLENVNNTFKPNHKKRKQNVRQHKENVNKALKSDFLLHARWSKWEAPAFLHFFIALPPTKQSKLRCNGVGARNYMKNEIKAQRKREEHVYKTKTTCNENVQKSLGLLWKETQTERPRNNLNHPKQNVKKTLTGVFCNTKHIYPPTLLLSSVLDILNFIN